MTCETKCVDENSKNEVIPAKKSKDTVRCGELTKRDNPLSLKYAHVKILPETDKNIANSLHVMCRNCLNAKTNNLKKNKEKRNITGNYVIYCNICDCDHNMNKGVFESTFHEHGEACKCIIF